MARTEALEEYASQDSCVLTLGFFDGVHLGHQDLLRRLVKEGHDNGLKSLVLTFDLRPRNRQKGLLTTLDARLKLMGEIGPDTILIQPFTEEFAALEPGEFLQKIAVEKLHAKVVLAGYDCRFGQGAQGDYSTMQKFSSSLGYLCHQEEPVKLEGEIISTTSCRQLLQEGKFRALKECLGRFWTIDGTVEHGRAVGRELGFPTANINIDGLALPPNGIYYATTPFGKALLYLGTRPTFGGEKEPVAEAFLLDASPDLYGQALSITPQKKLGDEKRYPSLDALKMAIAGYVAMARAEE